MHGGADSGHVHDEEFTVMGLLAPTGTPHDKTVYVHLDGFYQIQGHDKPLNEANKREREFYAVSQRRQHRAKQSNDRALSGGL